MLTKLSRAPLYTGPIVTIVLDCVGISPRAHGKAVGLPSDDDMGNSEVGHNALGSGQVVEQGASLVNQAIATGKIFERDSWKEITANVLMHKSTLHFLGLFSDGGVHSHVDHLKALILQ